LPEQLRVLGRLKSIRGVARFYLAGRTAIAFHLHHRGSDDIELFGPEDASFAPFHRLAREEPRSAQVVSEGEATLQMDVTRVPIDAVRVPYPLLEEPSVGSNGVLTVGLRYLATNELAAISKRGLRRDFRDLCAIVRRGLPLERACADCVARFGVAERPLPRREGSTFVRGRGGRARGARGDDREALEGDPTLLRGRGGAGAGRRRASRLSLSPRRSCASARVAVVSFLQRRREAWRTRGRQAMTAEAEERRARSGPSAEGPVGFRRIAVATDFGAASRRAVEVAVEMAERFGAELFVVHAVEPFVPPYPIALMPDLGTIDTAARRELDAAIARVREKVPGAKDELLRGGAVEQICAFVTERVIDLLVVGTHGRRGASRWLIGSVAEKLVRRAGVPVLTVGGERDDGRA
jgi:nucleotide-binding universal stress UspA family protein